MFEHFVQRRQHQQVERDQVTGRSVQIRHHDRRHPRGERSAHAGGRILERDTFGGADAEPARRLDVDVGCGLAACDLVATYDVAKARK